MKCKELLMYVFNKFNMLKYKVTLCYWTVMLYIIKSFFMYVFMPNIWSTILEFRMHARYDILLKMALFQN